MNSSVIGTIELADQPIEALAPTPAHSLPARIRRAYQENAPNADFAIVSEEVIDADLSTIRLQLQNELSRLIRTAHLIEIRA